MEFLYPASGFLVGTLVGLTGIGGGAVMTPLLVLVFGVPPMTAVGTDLLFAAVTKTVGVGMHGLRGTIDWQVVRRLALGSVPAAVLTGGFMHGPGRGSAQIDAWVMGALGVMLILTAIGLLLKESLHRLGRRLRLQSAAMFKHVQAPLTVIAGVFLGIVVTLTSVGAGAFGAVLLVYLYPLRLTPARLVGTDLAHAIPLALVAGAGHWLAGQVNWQLLTWLLLGSLPGVLLGTWVSSRAPERPLRWAIAAVLGVCGGRIVWG